MSVFPSDFKCIAVSAALKVPMWSSKKVRTVTTVNQFAVFVHAQDEQNLSDPNLNHSVVTDTTQYHFEFQNVPTPHPDPLRNYSVLVMSFTMKYFRGSTSASVLHLQIS